MPFKDPAKARASQAKAQRARYWADPEAARKYYREATANTVLACGTYGKRQAEKKHAKDVAAKLLAKAAARAQIAIRGYSGTLQPNHL
jgi:hypothetical protein